MHQSSLLETIPSPKKSTAGAAETFGSETLGATCFSSVEIFALPLFTEVGINEKDVEVDFVSGTSSRMLVPEGASFAGVGSSSSSSSTEAC